jgi:hypothetical protein
LPILSSKSPLFFAHAAGEVEGNPTESQVSELAIGFQPIREDHWVVADLVGRGWSRADRADIKLA